LPINGEVVELLGIDANTVGEGLGLFFFREFSERIPWQRQSSGK
jgi:hypothetical protein